ncbi:endonuclease III [archaeon]|nr:endonuclease III [archaeon]
MKSNTDFQAVFSLLEKNRNKTFLGFAASKKNYSPFQILISTVLSQRTKDRQTALASEMLFKKFPTTQAMANAGLKKIRQSIKQSGFYKVKSRRLKAIARLLVEKFNGKVPSTESELLSLPGVGFKTAACTLVYAFGIPSICVDTHVHRVSNRLGWVKTKSPEKTRHALMQLIPKNYWLKLNGLLVKHGQSVCLPRNPKCLECRINAYCNYFKEKFSKQS